MEIPKGFETVQGNCEAYMEAVIPDGASQVQIDETRKAFFAGATIGYELVMRVTVHDDEEKCMKALSEINNELQNFVNKVNSGE